MTAALQYITNIDTAYPLAGQNNNSQGYHAHKCTSTDDEIINMI